MSDEHDSAWERALQFCQEWPNRVAVSLEPWRTVSQRDLFSAFEAASRLAEAIERFAGGLFRLEEFLVAHIEDPTDLEWVEEVLGDGQINADLLGSLDEMRAVSTPANDLLAVVNLAACDLPELGWWVESCNSEMFSDGFWGEVEAAGYSIDPNTRANLRSRSFGMPIQSPSAHEAIFRLGEYYPGLYGDALGLSSDRYLDPGFGEYLRRLYCNVNDSPPWGRFPPKDRLFREYTLAERLLRERQAGDAGPPAQDGARWQGKWARLGEFVEQYGAPGRATYAAAFAAFAAEFPDLPLPENTRVFSAYVSDEKRRREREKANTPGY